MIVIFKVYIFSRIFKKRELSENIYNAKSSTFTVLVPPPQKKGKKYVFKDRQATLSLGSRGKDY